MFNGRIRLRELNVKNFILNQGNTYARKNLVTIEKANNIVYGQQNIFRLILPVLLVKVALSWRLVKAALTCKCEMMYDLLVSAYDLLM